MKTVQFPRGGTEAEDGALGLQGQVRVDTDRNELRLHDGVTPGGHRIPNLPTIQALIASGGEGATGLINFYSTEAELAASVPKATTLAVVSSAGIDDVFVWHPGVGDSGTIASAVDGHWRRLDGAVGFAIRLWRAGLFTIQIGGAAPAANQNTTAWLDQTTPPGTLKIYNGAAYAAATPTLFARQLAFVGNYYTGTVSMPDRLADVETQIADLNTVTDSGWYKSSAGAANAPVAGVHSFEHRQIDASNMLQMFIVQNSATRDVWTRFKVAGAWSGWVIASQLPAGRLSAAGATGTDANALTDAGFYYLPSTAANLPAVDAFTFLVLSYGSGYKTQIATQVNSPYSLWVRTQQGGTWQAWRQLWEQESVLMAPNRDPVDADMFAIRNTDTGALNHVLYSGLKSAMHSALLPYFAQAAGSMSSTGIADANALIQEGWFPCSATWTGSVFAGTSGNNQGYLESVKWGTAGTDYMLQRFYPVNGPNTMYTRRKNAGVWEPWYRGWNEANDGSGSGLDADTVDGIHGSSFLTATTKFLGSVALAAGTTSQGITGFSNANRRLLVRGHDVKTNQTGGSIRMLLSSNSGGSWSTGINFCATPTANANYQPLAVVDTAEVSGWLKAIMVYDGANSTPSYQVDGSISGSINGLAFTASSGAAFAGGTIDLYGLT